LVLFDDGDGAALYAGGTFTQAGGVEANYIARWDGSSWSSVGGGMDGSVHALAVLKNDSRGATGVGLYAGGWFTTAGGVKANAVARWDGTSWSPLGDGVNGWLRALPID
jgi:trimeric autotransporter adhesin